MHEWVEKLLALQEMDLRIDRLEEQLRSVPEEKQQATGLLNSAKEAVAAAKAQVVADEKAIKSLEMEVGSIQQKMRDFQSKSALIKNNEDYKAALAQIESCRKQISGLEDRELELMQDLEDSRRRLEAQNRELVATQTRVDEIVKDLETRERNCAAEVQSMAAERAEALAEVPADPARRYERMRGSRRGAGRRVFVPVREGACDGCHMRVTAQMRMDVRKGQLVVCPHCGSMLFDEE